MKKRSIKYEKHGIIFEVDGIKRHSFYHYGLYLKNITLDLPDAKTNLIDAPARNGSIDFTEANGNIFYKNRKQEFVFTCDDKAQLLGKVDELINFASGKVCKIYIWRDRQHYMQGRVFVDKYKSSLARGEVTITCDCFPYRMTKNKTTRYFRSEQKNISAGYWGIKINNPGMATQFTVRNLRAANNIVKFNDIPISAEGTTDPSFILKTGENTLKFAVGGRTTEEILITYQEGIL